MAENLHRGIVVSNADPEGKGRVRLRVPSVFGQTVTGWASSVLGGDVGPAAGTVVWVTFEAGDGSRPAYFSPEHEHPHDHTGETWFSGHDHVQYAQLYDPSSPTDAPDTYPAGLSYSSVLTADGWPGTGTVLTVNRHSSSRFYQEYVDYTGTYRMFRTYHVNTGWTAWRTIMDSTGEQSFSGTLKVLRTGTGDDFVIQSPTPQLHFSEDGYTGAGKNWWFHQNAGAFYLLRDSDGDGGWNSPHPLHFGADGSLTHGGVVRHTEPIISTHVSGSAHPEPISVLNWGSNTSLLTGYLVIQTNMPGVNDMSHLKITGYSYEGATAAHNVILDLTVAGYLRSTTSTIVNGAYINNGRPLEMVRWAKDASNNIVLILGSPTTLWRYPHVVVDYFRYRHSSAHAESHFQNWTATVTTDITPYTIAYDVPPNAPSGNWARLGSFDMGTGALTTVTTIFSGIPSNFTRLRLVAPWMSHASTSSSYLYMRINGSSSAIYGGHFLYHSTSQESGTYQSAQAQAILMYAYFYGGAGRDSFIDVEFYQQASRVTMFDAIYGTSMVAAGYHYGGQTKGTINTTAKVSSIQIWGNLATNWTAGSKFYLYGAVDH